MAKLKHWSVEMKLEWIRGQVMQSLREVMVKSVDFILNAVEWHLDIIKQGSNEI